jgi:signal transduction histidine kinase
MGLPLGMDAPVSGFTEADLRSALKRAHALKDAILRNINHEFRSPLNKIIGYGELLSDLLPAACEQARNYLNRIMAASQCIERNVQAILDLSKFEAGDFAAHPSEIDLWPLIKRQLFEIRPAAEAKGLRLQHEIEDQNLSAIVDEYCLTHALANILDNAIKFTESGRIVVRLKTKKPGRVCIEVEDTGIGIDPSYLPNLFEPFSQQDSSSTRQYDGLAGC